MVVAEFKNVNYKYPLTDEYALKEINFQFEEGKFYGLIGENGGGKTTLCNLISFSAGIFYVAFIVPGFDADYIVI